MNISEKFHNKLYALAFLVLLSPVLMLSACSGTGSTQQRSNLQMVDTSDLSCSYFYFLWGTHAEFNQKYPEALDAFENALVCDPQADYIKHKLPLIHLKNKDPKQAISLLEQAVEEDPQDSASRTLLASIFVQQKSINKAVEHYKEILSYEPDNEQILLRLGVLLSQTGEPEKAGLYLRKLVQINPESYFGHLALARITESPQKAVVHFLKALQLNWSVDLSYEIAQFYLQQKQYAEAIELLRSVLEKTDNQEQAQLAIVQALLAMENEEAAIAELSLIPDYRNSPLQLSLALSKLYLRLNDHQHAIEHLTAILKDTNNAHARYLLGVIYSDLEQFNDALEVLELIEPDQQEFEDAVFLRVKILHQSDRVANALALLESYLADQSTRRPMFFVMAASLYQDNTQQTLATDQLARGYALYPKNERLLFEYGLQLERTGQLEKAISIMEELLIIDPDHAEALNFVGYSWADANQRLEEALDYINRAVELKPGNGYIQDSLGWVHFRLGNLELARSELLGALSLLPEDPHIHDHLGDVYLAIGDKAKARDLYKKALKLFDDKDKKERVQKKIDALSN